MKSERAKLTVARNFSKESRELLLCSEAKNGLCQHELLDSSGDE